MLSKNVAQVRKLTGDFWSILALVLTTVLGGVVIALYYCPRLAGVIIATLPLVAGSGFVMGKLLMDNDEEAMGDLVKHASEYASTVISNIKTVLSTGQARESADAYKVLLKDSEVVTATKARTVALSAFVSEFVKFAAFGLAFWYSGRLYTEGHCDFTEIFEALTGVLFCGIFAGMYAGQLPDVTDAKEQVAAFLQFQDTMVQTPAEAGLKPAPAVSIAGAVEYRGVHFAYPTRPDQEILQGLDLTINVGETVAIVGASGSGKSTIMMLTQKFYKPTSGSILVDGKDIQDMDTEGYRDQIAAVSQEPKLFNTSIYKNITYRHKASTPTLLRDVEKAAAEANAAGFIGEQKGKYDREVGELGEALSGGQRQRVAIAQALFIDNIKILLLDEATSALDVKSEQAVQDALEKAQANRTTIIVAHRLSTIKKCDRIIVLEKGRCAEEGTFQELLGKTNSAFRSFYQANLSTQE